MHVSHLHIEGFKRFPAFDVDFNETFNLIVGDNETGKSTILEALGLVLTGHYGGRPLTYGIDPYLFNAGQVTAYFQALRQGKYAVPPTVLLEVYFGGVDTDPQYVKLRGTHNSKAEDVSGLALRIELDTEYTDALKEYASDDLNPTVLPVEFFRFSWRSFAGEAVSLRNIPVRATVIDTTLPRVHRGPNKYVSQVVSEVLSDDQRRQLSLEYKKLRHSFSQEAGIAAINEYLEEKGHQATSKSLTIQMDMSSRAGWDSAITPHLDDLPFDCAGKGEQCNVQVRLAIAGAQSSGVLLIEEPENHLSHSNLNILLNNIRSDCGPRQVIITTHSAFVLNKLGLDNLILISPSGATARLTALSEDTKNYFMKLPGYNTLRVVLAGSSILVEGPSDELVIQRAYVERHGRLPLEDGVDIISVGALAFRRFLEIAELLHLRMTVITDNDGEPEALTVKYAPYVDGKHPRIQVHFGDDAALNTMEPHLLKVVGLPVLNRIFGTNYAEDADILKYMARHKADCALALFESTEPWPVPTYISNAIA